MIVLASSLVCSEVEADRFAAVADGGVQFGEEIVAVARRAEVALVPHRLRLVERRHQVQLRALGTRPDVVRIIDLQLCEEVTTVRVRTLQRRLGLLTLPDAMAFV